MSLYQNKDGEKQTWKIFFSSLPFLFTILNYFIHCLLTVQIYLSQCSYYIATGVSWKTNFRNAAIITHRRGVYIASCVLPTPHSFQIMILTKRLPGVQWSSFLNPALFWLSQLFMGRTRHAWRKSVVFVFLGGSGIISLPELSGVGWPAHVPQALPCGPHPVNLLPQGSNCYLFSLLHLYSILWGDVG